MSNRTRRGRGGRNGHEPRSRIDSRQLRALELSNQGFTQVEIASALGITQAAVSKILRRVETQILKDRPSLIERHWARQILRLEHIYNEAMRAWTRSIGDRTRRRQRRIQDGKKEPMIAELVVETDHGNPQYLEVGRKALADIRKLGGINAPENISVATRPANPYSDLSDEELRDKLVSSAHRILQLDELEKQRPQPQDLQPPDPLEVAKAAYAAELERRKRNPEGS